MSSPLAYLYARKDGTETFARPERANMDPRYWTETPLFAAHPVEAEALEWPSDVRGFIERAVKAEARAAKVEAELETCREALEDIFNNAKIYDRSAYIIPQMYLDRARQAIRTAPATGAAG